ncbi:MAG: hypothetical protein A4S09_11515 [Proteobacteria bacterium SG_bin7]|nr:MAG: hypothetical protein A4S09_11515 [Proteobacteria bacterium SG_bin7]
MISFSHAPVMLNEVISVFKESQTPLNVFLDGTFGRGGHTKALIENFPGVHVWGMDQDEEAIAAGKALSLSNLTLVHGNFSEFEKKIVEQKSFDGILLDLGVSSPQLDDAGRGFSFYHDGPLDMRMDRSQKMTAADIINGWDEDELIDLFKNLGEVRNPFRVVRAIVHDRKTTLFTTTRQLAGMIERVSGWRKKGFNPATQYFMALRLQVNGELQILEETLPKLMNALADKGRAVVITFHSLEDRIVKNIFKNNPELGRPVSKKVVKPSREEQKFNPRSRSAKLRAFERGAYEY